MTQHQKNALNRMREEARRIRTEIERLTPADLEDMKQATLGTAVENMAYTFAAAFKGKP